MTLFQQARAPGRGRGPCRGERWVSTVVTPPVPRPPLAAAASGGPRDLGGTVFSGAPRPLTAANGGLAGCVGANQRLERPGARGRPMGVRGLACSHLKHARTEFSRSWAASVERACLELCADDTAAKLGLKLRLESASISIAHPHRTKRSAHHPTLHSKTYRQTDPLRDPSRTHRHPETKAALENKATLRSPPPAPTAPSPWPK